MNKHKLLAKFLQTWSIERLRNMSIEKYTNLKKSDSFCYWLEQRTNELGGITGGSSFKFGIYKRNNTEKEITTSNVLTDGEYAWFAKYGQTRDEAFEAVRNIIVQIAQFATDKQFDKIENIDLGETTKWKIAFIYSDYQLINTFSKDMVCSILDFLQIDYSYDESRFSLSNKILSQKRENEDYFDFGSKFWNEILISQGLKKVLTKLGNRVFPYFDTLDRIIESFNLEPNNDKYYFSYNSKELIFTIGQRYIWNLTKNEYKYISLTKDEEKIEIFGRENQEPEAYLNFSKNPENFSNIYDRMLIPINNELTSTIKASHRNQNKKDLQELAFNKEFRNKIFNNKRRLFVQWLNKQFGEKNGTNNSYVRAIDILSELLNVDLFTISEIEYFKSLYNDLIINQKDESGKYYFEKAKSYGKDDFYSASIQTYINFLSSASNQLNEPISIYTTMDTKIPLNQILYGPPGTGKTYNTINKAIEIVNPEIDLTQDRNTIKQEYNRLIEEGQIVFTTFHQSMTYEDFIEGIKPETKDNNVIYNIKNGLFKEIVSKAIDNWKKSTSGTKQTKPFDKVFQLLKDEWEENPMIEFPMKREGNDFKILGFSDSSISFLKASGTNNHTLSINTLRDLYYGIREFQNQGVGIYYPSIVDKLNSYDVDFESESINSDIKNFVIVIDEINRGNVSQIFGELITLIEEDKRLGNDEVIEVTLPYSKEKFGVPPNLYIIGTMNTADRSVEALDTALRRRFVFEEMPPKYDLEGLQQDLFGFTASHLLETINKRIEKLLDKDHQIGHAYFINKNETTIIDSFYKNIIPLLQEYFFGDYGKIGLVLGEGFVEDMNKKDNSSIFPKFYDLDSSQFEEKESYEIINHRNNIEGFNSAIQLLMKR